MADLLTLNELKGYLGVDVTDTRNDVAYTAALSAASLAIRNYTERDFGATQVTEQRPYTYDGSGYLDIDDCTVITDVQMTVPHGNNLILTTDDYVGQPSLRDDSPVFYYILLPGLVGNTMGDPAMGFTRNMDLYAAEGRLRALPNQILVTATFGWPTVPADVKQAAAWTIVDWTSKGKKGDENLTAEAIEGYSRAWNKLGGAFAQSVPNRARDILAFYMKVHV